jgi:hypothetical protein
MRAGLAKSKRVLSCPSPAQPSPTTSRRHFEGRRGRPQSPAAAISVLAAISLTRRTIARTGESTADGKTLGQEARRPNRARRRASRALVVLRELGLRF